MHVDNRDDFKQQKLLDEARKAGKAPALVDEEGHAINPHIPEYIVKAPWYLSSGQPSLKHQRSAREKTAPSTESQQRGLIQPDQVITKFRRGACENCGSMTHKTRDCVDRPRKVGAKYSSTDIQPDEFVVPGPRDFDGKRDRWAGFDPADYAKVVENFEKVEDERRKLKEAEAETELKRKIAVDTELADGDSDDDEEKYAEAVDMPGQKVNTKTRMTIRNLRIREDTAKYLRNLDPESAHYDPKTRSMRENPNADADPDKLTYTGDNFVRMSGDARRVTELQVFAWQASERGQDVSLQANPSEMERLYRTHIQQRDEERRRLDKSLQTKYGDQPDTDSLADLLCDE